MNVFFIASVCTYVISACSALLTFKIFCQNFKMYIKIKIHAYIHTKINEDSWQEIIHFDEIQ